MTFTYIFGACMADYIATHLCTDTPANHAPDDQATPVPIAMTSPVLSPSGKRHHSSPALCCIWCLHITSSVGPHHLSPVALLAPTGRFHQDEFYHAKQVYLGLHARANQPGSLSH